jgi:hypothetical protein
MQEQAGGERPWPTPPSIGTRYQRRVPVKLKQRPRLVSAATVITFVDNAGTDSLVTGGSGRLEDGLARRVAAEANVQADWRWRGLSSCR